MLLAENDGCGSGEGAPVPVLLRTRLSRVSAKVFLRVRGTGGEKAEEERAEGQQTRPKPNPLASRTGGIGREGCRAAGSRWPTQCCPVIPRQLGGGVDPLAGVS